MTNKDVEEYFATPKGEQVKNFIEQDRQDAIVYNAITDVRHDTIIQCYSPVWKTIEMRLDSFDTRKYGVQRGDIIELGREKNARGGFDYSIYESKTAKQIKDAGIKKILKDFDETQQHNLMVIGDFQRMGIMGMLK